MKHKAISYGAALVILLATWHLGSLALQKPFLPTPLASIQAFVELWRHEDMGTHFLISAYRVIASIVLAVIFAVPLGLVMGRSEKVDRLLSPMVYLLYPLPKDGLSANHRCPHGAGQ